jgi:hypothetical protein
VKKERDKDRVTKSEKRYKQTNRKIEIERKAVKGRQGDRET